MNYTQDAAQSAEAFLISQLTYLEPEIYRVQYPQIRYRELVPIDTSAPMWIPSVTYFSLDGVGKANWFNGRANDVPLAELTRAKYETPVKMAAIGYEYDLEELAQAQMLGRNLTTDKGYYARLAAEQFTDNVTLFGDATVGFTGLLNNPAVSSGTVAANGSQNGMTNSTLWINKLPAQILADVNMLLTSIAVATTNIEMADTLLLGISAFNYLSSTPYSALSDLTILEWLRKNNVFTARTGQPLLIRSVWGLDTAGAGGTNRMVAYWRNPVIVKLHIPMPFQFVGGVWRDGPILWKVPGIFRIGGVDIKRPGAFRYADGF